MTERLAYHYPRLFACINTHTSLGAPLLSISRSASLIYTYKKLSTGMWSEDDKHTYIHTFIHKLDCFHKHAYTSLRFPLTHIQESFPYAHAALHATCVLIFPMWGESS